MAWVNYDYEEERKGKMDGTVSLQRRVADSLGIAAILIAFALPAAAKPGPRTLQSANVTNATAGPSASIREAAEVLTRNAAQLSKKAIRETPELEIVDGALFRQTLDRVAWLARECERKIAADEMRGKPGTFRRCLKELREVRNEVFNLRVHSIRVWLPTSGSACCYMVDVHALQRLCDRIARLSHEVCNSGTEKQVTGDESAAKSSPTTTRPKQAVKDKVTPTESIQKAAEKLARTTAHLPNPAKGKSPRTELVDGKFFRQTLDLVAWVARECERRIAADTTHAKPGATHPWAGDLRAIGHEAFDLRMNAMRIWLPASGGRCSYMVNTHALHELCNRTVCLSEEICARYPESGAERRKSADKPASIETTHVNASLIW